MAYFGIGRTFLVYNLDVHTWSSLNCCLHFAGCTHNCRKEVLLGWSFTTLPNHNVAIWWGFFRLTAPAALPVHIGADSLKKPHHIATLWFSEVVNDHPNWGFFRLSASMCMVQWLKKPSHITTLWFSKVVNDHPTYHWYRWFLLQIFIFPSF